MLGRWGHGGLGGLMPRVLVQTVVRYQDSAMIDVLRDDAGVFDIVVSRSRAHIARVFSRRALDRYLSHGMQHRCGPDCVRDEAGT
jgi:hypothetical protein